MERIEGVGVQLYYKYHIYSICAPGVLLFFFGEKQG